MTPEQLRLPQKFVDEYSKDIGTVTIFGTPIENLSILELQCSLVMALKERDELHRSHSQSMEMMRMANSLKRG